jgi:hypothetical protein
MYTLTAAAFSIDACRPFCMRHYDLICATTIVVSCAGCVATYVLVEVRRALFQNPDFPHIRWGIDYSHGWPRRTCADADPARTWSHPPEHSINSNGCNNLVLSGGAFADYLRDWTISLIADDYAANTTAGLGSQYVNPAWNFRSIYPGLRLAGGAALGVYPIATRSLVTGVPQRIPLAGGTSSYVRFSVPAGQTALISLSSNGQLPAATLRYGIVRLR